MKSRSARPRLASAARGSIATLAGVFTLAGMVAVGCGDDDTTDVVNMGGSAGSGATAGSSGSGNGGSGMGGSAVTGSGGNAGTGMGGSAQGGSAQGGSGDEPDAGDAGPVDGGDAGPVDPRTPVVAEICVRLDAVAACSDVADCIATQLDNWTLVEDDFAANCPELAEDYFVCLSTAPQDDFSCSGDVPGYTGFDPEGACADEELAVFAVGCPQ